MKIAIVGTGAMGSVYAGLLAAAGNEVWAIDTWPEHIAAIREHGLRVEGASGDRTVRVHATSSPEDVGIAELVIVATKARDVEQAARSAVPLVGEDTLVLPIQNGLGSADRVASIIGAEQVAIGVVGGFGASLVAPGHVRHEGWELVRLGERGRPAERASNASPRYGVVPAFASGRSTTSIAWSGRSSCATSASAGRARSSSARSVR